MASMIRAASVIAAITASLTLMLFPFVLHHVPAARLHSALPILMFGVAGAFVHGIGYTADNRLLRILFGPTCAWSMILTGAALLFAE
jgi:predicted membrane protein